MVMSKFYSYQFPLNQNYFVIVYYKSVRNNRYLHVFSELRVLYSSKSLYSTTGWWQEEAVYVDSLKIKTTFIKYLNNKTLTNIIDDKLN